MEEPGQSGRDRGNQNAENEATRRARGMGLAKGKATQTGESEEPAAKHAEKVERSGKGRGQLHTEKVGGKCSFTQKRPTSDTECSYARLCASYEVDCATL